MDRWNAFDGNIQLTAYFGLSANFLDLHIENKVGQLCTSVYQKPSYEPYYLPFNSIRPLHMKKNIPFAMLLRAIRYCSTFEGYLNERTKLRIALLVNKYPASFIDDQFDRLLYKFGIKEILTIHNYGQYRGIIIDSPIQIKLPIDHGITMFVHFTYCSNIRAFPKQFHELWNKYFKGSPIKEIAPVLGTRNVSNLQRRPVHTRT